MGIEIASLLSRRTGTHWFVLVRCYHMPISMVGWASHVRRRFLSFRARVPACANTGATLYFYV